MTQPFPGTILFTILLVSTPFGARGQNTPVAEYREALAGTQVTFEMVPLPAGAVTIETAAGKVQREVKPVWISRTEVTWDMYDVFALKLDGGSSADVTTGPSRPYGAPDYGYGHAGYPVISVTRSAAEAFCVWLSAKTGKKYRLPTEAEWVHAANLALLAGDLPSKRRDAVAWHKDNSGGKTHPVGKKEEDALGLHDLLGNAAEWVMSEDGKPVVMGGAYVTPRSQLRAAYRMGWRWEQDSSWNERDPQLPKSSWWLSDGPFIGFRIVREP